MLCPCCGSNVTVTHDRGEIDRSLDERRAAMTRAQRLERVFKIGIETCPVCGGAMRIIVACIEDPASLACGRSRRSSPSSMRKRPQLRPPRRRRPVPRAERRNTP
jgi:rRNA maturation protein Nop10